MSSILSKMLFEPILIYNMYYVSISKFETFKMNFYRVKYCNIHFD